MTAADLIRRIEPDGEIAAAEIDHAGGVADVVPICFVEAPAPRGFEIVEPFGYGLELVNRLWGEGGPRS